MDIIQAGKIPQIQFKRSSRARRLSIRIKPYKGVQVTVPNGMSMSVAEKFVKQKRDWIVLNLEKIKQLEAKDIIYDGSKAIRTRTHQLVVLPCQSQIVKYKINNGKILISYPEEMKLDSPELQSFIAQGLIAAYRIEAKKYLPERVSVLAQQYSFKYNRVFIKNHRSRWGSCSAQNNINLSLHLMRLPDHLIDYVILHELVHTEIKNHSPAFWRRLEEVCPQVQFHRKELRRQARDLKRLN